MGILATKNRSKSGSSKQVHARLAVGVSASPGTTGCCKTDIYLGFGVSYRARVDFDVILPVLLLGFLLGQSDRSDWRVREDHRLQQQATGGMLLTQHQRQQTRALRHL